MMILRIIHLIDFDFSNAKFIAEVHHPFAFSQGSEM